MTKDEWWQICQAACPDMDWATFQLKWIVFEHNLRRQRNRQDAGNPADKGEHHGTQI
jgi:hypothetical protein